MPNKLSLKEARQLARKLCYRIVSGKENSSRCIDGRYSARKTVLPPLAKPGADIGDLLIILATLRFLKLKIVKATVLKIIEKTVGEARNFAFHSDSHEPDSYLGCGHLKQARLNPKDYGLTSGDIDFIFQQALPYFEKSGAVKELLQGDHSEKAILVVDSLNYSLKTADGSDKVFVYHKTLDVKRKKLLAKNLASFLTSNFSEKIIFRTIDEISEKQLKTIIKKLAPELPIFKVKIRNKNDIKLTKLLNFN